MNDYEAPQGAKRWPRGVRIALTVVGVLGGLYVAACLLFLWALSGVQFG